MRTPVPDTFGLLLIFGFCISHDPICKSECSPNPISLSPSWFIPNVAPQLVSLALPPLPPRSSSPACTCHSHWGSLSCRCDSRSTMGRDCLPDACPGGTCAAGPWTTPGAAGLYRDSEASVQLLNSEHQRRVPGPCGQPMEITKITRHISCP